MEPTRYRIELDEAQLAVVLAALDTYSRMGMGQLDVAVGEFISRHAPKGYDQDSRDMVRFAIDTIKRMVWGHPPNGSWGIFSPEVPRACRESYDILQVLRYARWEVRRDRGEAPSYTVENNPYLPANPEWPPVTCVAVDDLP